MIDSVSLWRSVCSYFIAGDVDYICNWLGNKKWVKALEWEGKENFHRFIFKLKLTEVGRVLKYFFVIFVLYS